ncbi:hypothetical protein TELCIR_21728 [Teladorsagia circumcincta]|uniref:Uncharacterized protein n=1 Tax=Teladorsagia circumcincta TaxID=45464 RepID=A0A2G9TG00_TELCI|nr:hypothetical protein TELCIR_21728 [Teladorsagia circumcincta]
MESRSKFACLNIDDDSDEEFTRVANNKAASKKGGQNGLGGAKVKNGGKLVVHAIEKRPKAKKSNKDKIVDPTTGLVVQGVDESYASEQKYREDLKQALRESTQTAAKQTKAPSPKETTPPSVEVKEEHSPSMIDKILASIDEESRKQTKKPSADGETDADALIIALYRSKLTEAIEEMLKANEKAQSAQAEVDKYRTKYRKLVELFRDTEVTEKAKLVMDLEKTRTSEAELASQLVVTQRELEQCRSKLRALGALR